MPFIRKSIPTVCGISVYDVFVPIYWAPRRKWPVILFLHGDEPNQPLSGIRTLISVLGDNFPCLVVCPQRPTGRQWTEYAAQKAAISALDHVIEEYNGDTNRVYLTGASKGGLGTWSIAADCPDRWAAIVPVCSSVVWPMDIRVPNFDIDNVEYAVRGALGTGGNVDPYAAIASRLQFVPIWTFHGTHDEVVPVSEPRQVVAALHAINGNVRFTEYGGCGHEAWQRAYAEVDLLTWLLHHRLPHERNLRPKRPYHRRQ